MKLHLKNNPTYINKGDWYCIELKKGQRRIAKNLLGRMHQIEVDSDIGPVRINADLLGYNAVYQLRD